MALPAGEHHLGPDDVTLSVRTGRSGAAAKAGHDLLIHVASWEATLVVGEEASASTLELVADSTSLQVVEGTGGIGPLGDDEIASIRQSIDDDVLRKQEIRFRSTGARAVEVGIGFDGELTLVGETKPVSFEVAIGDDGSLSSTVTVTQSTWGIKQFTILFGALKVADDVEVAAEGKL